MNSSEDVQQVGAQIIDFFHGYMKKISITPTLFFFYVDLKNQGNEVDNFLSDSFNWEMIMRLLSLRKQVAITNKKYKDTKYLSLFNAVLVKFVICIYEKSFEIWDQIDFRYGKYGKPYLKNRDYAFNLSDEDGVVSLAIDFSGKFTEIGVDLANPKDIDNFQISDLSDFYKTEFKGIFTQKERDFLDTVFHNATPALKTRDTQLKFLSQFWALKESYTKYKGIGLKDELHNYEFLNIKKLKDNGQHPEKYADLAPLTPYSDWKWVKQDEACCFDPEVQVYSSLLPGNDIVVCIIGKRAHSEIEPTNEHIPLSFHLNPISLLQALKQLSMGETG